MNPIAKTLLWLTIVMLAAFALSMSRADLPGAPAGRPCACGDR